MSRHQPRDRRGRFGECARTEQPVDLGGQRPPRFHAFHADIGFPPPLTKESFRIRARLTYSGHAISAAQNDRYGHIETPDTVDTAGWEPIELKLHPDTGKVARVLFRSPADDRGLCTCMVLAPTGERRHWRVITLWLNEADDDHATLDRSTYMTPQEWSSMRR